MEAGDIYIPTYILTWNPERFRWTDYKDICALTQSEGYRYITDWSCRSKRPQKGDRFILLLQGQGKKNGIVGYGTINSKPYDYFADTVFGRRFVDIVIERLWDYTWEDYVKTEVLKEKYPDQCWTPQFSGTRVKSAILPDLWFFIEIYNLGGENGNTASNTTTGK